jgi:hypothetical protein
MRTIGWKAAVAGLAAMTLGAAAAQAGSQVSIAIGPPVPYFFPPPNTIPAPIAPLPGAPSTAPTVAPLPPLVLYAAPPVVVPVPRR